MPSKEKERKSGLVIEMIIKEGNVKKDRREYELTPLLAKLINIDFFAAPFDTPNRDMHKEKAKVKDMKEFFSKYA